MARIDVQTLVLAFEKRIELLEKNPPDKVSTSVVINLLERAIDDEIKNHFVELIRRDVVKAVKKEFAQMRDEFIKKTVGNILQDDAFRTALEKNFKDNIMNGFRDEKKWI